MKTSTYSSPDLTSAAIMDLPRINPDQLCSYFRFLPPALPGESPVQSRVSRVFPSFICETHSPVQCNFLTPVLQAFSELGILDPRSAPQGVVPGMDASLTLQRWCLVSALWENKGWNNGPGPAEVTDIPGLPISQSERRDYRYWAASVCQYFGWVCLICIVLNNKALHRSLGS